MSPICWHPQNRQTGHHGAMPQKDRPQVDRNPPINGEGWLWSEQQQLVCRFRNDVPTQHAKWIEVETRSCLKGGPPPIRRRMLRHNAIEAWIHMQKTGWVRCQPRW